jgi:hypothetical protein
LDGLYIDAVVMINLEDRFVQAKIKKINREESLVDAVLDNNKPIKCSFDQISFIKEDTVSFKVDEDFLLSKRIDLDEEDVLIRSCIEKGFRKFLRKHNEQYAFLREINLDNVIEGDHCAFSECYQEVEIIEIDEDDIFTIKIDNNVIKIPKADLRPLENRIQKLKKNEIKYLYDFIENEIPMHIYDHKKIIYIFVDFFRIGVKNISILID